MKTKTKTKLERELTVLGPDLAYRGREVFLEGVCIGSFDKPWDILRLIREGVLNWTKSLDLEGK